MNSRSPFECFGVPIEGTSFEETLERIRAGSARWIVTANPEILLEAKRDPAYRDVLNRADLRIADGVGLALAARTKNIRLHRVTGVELSEGLMKEAAAQGWSVALIGGGEGVAARAAISVRAAYPALRVGTFHGGNINADGSGDGAAEESLAELRQFKPNVILVAFGHPKQERWIARNIADFPDVKAIIGVGGTLDFWSQDAKRAPAWMRTFGLEWLHRLARDPRRIGRILRAIIVFPVVYFLS